MASLNTLEWKGTQCKECGFIVAEDVLDCPSCGSSNLESVPIPETGAIYSFTVVHVGFGYMAERAPYILAIIELDPATKLTTVLEDVSDLQKIKIGTQVKLKRIDDQIGPIFSPT